MRLKISIPKDRFLVLDGKQIELISQLLLHGTIMKLSDKYDDSSTLISEKKEGIIIECISDSNVDLEQSEFNELRKLNEQQVELLKDKDLEIAKLEQLSAQQSETINALEATQLNLMKLTSNQANL